VVEPVVIEPKVTVETESVSWGAPEMPVPVSVTLCEPPVALLATVNVPVRAPVAVGAKETRSVQVLPGLSVPQVLLPVCVKSPAMVTPAITRFAVPVFVRLSDCCELVKPWATDPKVSEVADSVRMALAGVPLTGMLVVTIDPHPVRIEVRPSMRMEDEMTRRRGRALRSDDAEANTGRTSVDQIKYYCRR